MFIYTRLIKKLADHKKPTTLAAKYRRERFTLFLNLIERLEAPLTILDVGGTMDFWDRMETYPTNIQKIVLLNKFPQEVTRPNFYSIIGDARDMEQFYDNEFDIVFSNSVIEHLSTIDDQQRMAEEIRRVGKRYFIQTPNRYFPIEPHFLLPFFQFLPLKVKCWLIQHFDLGWRRKAPDYESAMKIATEIRLLTKKELMGLFPEGKFVEERFLFFVKSFIIHHGW